EALTANLDVDGLQQAVQDGGAAPLQGADEGAQPSAQESAPEPLDSNTMMARQQAEDLGTNEIIAKAQKPQDEKAGAARTQQDGALSVKGAQAEAAVHEGIKAASAAEPSTPSPSHEGAQSAQDAPAAAQEQGQGKLALAVPADAKASAGGSEILKSSREDSAKGEAKKDDDRKDQKAAPASLGSVRTVSARVVNRRDIGSLNSVSVRVKGPVYLRILGNGKVLKEGRFKAGQSVSATGMPPIRIEVSDSSQVSISYNGGTVAAGSGRNVGFDLPTR
ncbi:MAG: RodZ domain-containing protein, partial [Succinivibrio sp.]